MIKLTHIFYCQKCGKVKTEQVFCCDKCLSTNNYIEANHELEYYYKLSFDKYHNNSHWYEFLEPEILQNPLIDKYWMDRQDSDEIYKSSNSYKIPTYHDSESRNVPKCPTCGSTNIEKISGVKRAASEIMFGIFSPTIGKTFCCKNCGYRW